MEWRTGENGLRPVARDESGDTGRALRVDLSPGQGGARPAPPAQYSGEVPS